MLYESVINILRQDSKYESFVKNLEKLQEKHNKQSDKNIKADKQLNEYIENLEFFYKDNVKEILQYEKLIAYNYVLFLIKFYKYIGVKNPSIEYLSEFRKFAIRVMEIALFMQQFKFIINDLFFNNAQKSFYENLINIYEVEFNSNNIKIIENSDTRKIDSYFKIHSDGIYIGEMESRFHYISSVKMASGYKKVSLGSYLRLYAVGVNNVYNLRSVIKKEGGGGGGQYIDLERLNPYPKELYYENKIVNNCIETSNSKIDRYESSFDNDEELEGIDKSRKRIVNKNDEQYTIRDSAKIYDNYIGDVSFKLKQKSLTDSNSYKKFKIDTAIGHLAAKANLVLESKYTVPNIKLLAKFLSEIKDKSAFEYKLLISSMLLGLEPRRIIAMKLKLTTELEIIRKDTIRVDLTTAYAQVSNYETYKKTKNKVEFNVPAFIEQFLQESEEVLFIVLQKIIKEYKTLLGNDVIEEFEASHNTSSLHEFMKNNFEEEVISSIYNKLLESQQKSISLYITKEKKLFSKTIVLTAKNLQILSLSYYKIFHDESDINLLFLQNKTANMHTKIAYVASPKKLSTMTLWIEELMVKLSLSETKPNKPIKMDNDYSGSNKLVTPQEFKTFLMILASLEFENKYVDVTLKMIYLRYVFSILLTSRKYYFSANLHQYSRRERLLFLHEKAKNVFNSKRIVPITELGDRYIQYFFKLRKEFLISSYSPVLLQDDKKVLDFNQKNLLFWFEQHKDEIQKKCTSEEYKILVRFSKTVLDFGRHIFASRAHNEMELSQDYTDAMLNHFERGTQDQGVYSLFDNQEYFSETRKIMEKIEKEYIPYWSEL